jgi:hypothetical protein
MNLPAFKFQLVFKVADSKTNLECNDNAKQVQRKTRV